MSIKNKTNILYVLTCISICSALSAHAQTQTSTISTASTSASTPRQERVLKACERTAEKIDEKITRFNDVHLDVQPRYQGIVIRLEALSQKLKARSVDTSKLDTSITELKTLVAKIDTDKTTFINELMSSKKLTCDSSLKSYKTALENSKKYQKAMVADNKALREYIEKTVKPELERLQKLSRSTNQPGVSGSSTPIATSTTNQ